MEKMMNLIPIMRQIMMTVAVSVVMASSVYAADLNTDLAGDDFGTFIVPKQRLLWEQTVPNVTYQHSGDVSNLTVQSEILARIGIGHDAELRLGWDGPISQRMKINGVTTTDSGVGDATVGIKKSVSTNDPRMTWALLLQANLATGDDGYSVEHPIYTLGSSLVYQYSERINTGMTMYYDHQGKDWAWSTVPNISYKINEQWSNSADLQYRKQESQPEQWHLNNSLSYNLNDNLQFTAAFGYGYSDNVHHYTGGLSVGYLF